MMGEHLLESTQNLLLQASPVAEEHSQYWATARRAVALGRAADAQDLLGLHSAFARFGEPRQRELVQPLVCATRSCTHNVTCTDPLAFLRPTTWYGQCMAGKFC